MAPAEQDFTKATHTFIVSDIHLSTAEPVNKKDPLWRKWKTREFFIDDQFEVFLDKAEEKAAGDSIELILAGDIFDFDGITEFPEIKARYRTSFIERMRGLNTEERKSRFKMRMILEHHPVFFRALSQFIKKGNRVVFIIGNHDLELHWFSVQGQILGAMNLNEAEKARVRFNNWFYISNKDTLVEHGNQHDAHSNCQNPISPIIRGQRKDRIRLPFGCLAHRYLLNGMGYFNPHSDRTYVLTARQYLKFLFSHGLRKEPLILWTWFWGALVTLFMTMKESLTPEVKNPLTVEDRIDEIAASANATPRIVRTLKEIHAPPAFMDPLAVLRELWLDRAFTVMGAFVVGFWSLGFLNIVWKVSYWWVLVIMLLFVPFFLFYFRSFKSKIIADVKYYEKAVKLSSRITGMKRVVFGHTHQFVHTNFEGVEYLNSGTWAPAFDDFECKKPACPKTFVWIRPEDDAAAEKVKGERVANVFEWKGKDMALLC